MKDTSVSFVLSLFLTNHSCSDSCPWRKPRHIQLGTVVVVVAAELVSIRYYE